MVKSRHKTILQKDRQSASSRPRKEGAVGAPLTVLLRKTADLLRRKLLSGAEMGNTISLKIDPVDGSDLFLDRLSEAALDELRKTYSDIDQAVHSGSSKIDSAALKRRLADMVFPWKTSKGTMVGYRAEPDIDEHYISAVTDYVLQCREKGGVHPEARVNGILISDISLIVLLILSTRLKHTQLVFAGKQKFPDVNYWMSLTVWKPKSEVVNSLSDYSGIDRFIVAAIIDMFTLSPTSNCDFSSDVDPVLPLFIQISKQYLLEPVSALFLNPFDTMIRLSAEKQAMQSIMAHREGVMIENLNSLFLGNRYWLLEAPFRLRKQGRVLTDIDAAILDRTTGELALFQLKWQDFRGATNSQIDSRARNFTQSISKWTETVNLWLEEHGVDQLRRSMKMPNDGSHPIGQIHLFAIGQSNAQFRYLGHSVESEAVAVTTWPRFVRMRHDLGPAERVFSALHKSILKSSNQDIKPTPIPYEMKVQGINIKFENLWNSFEDSSSSQGAGN